LLSSNDKIGCSSIPTMLSHSRIVYDPCVTGICWIQAGGQLHGGAGTTQIDMVLVALVDAAWPFQRYGTAEDVSTAVKDKDPCDCPNVSIQYPVIE